jgi:hypothetical protein
LKYYWKKLLIYFIVEIIAFKKNSLSKSPMKISIESFNGFSDKKENNSHETVMDQGKI